MIDDMRDKIGPREFSLPRCRSSSLLFAPKGVESSREGDRHSVRVQTTAKLRTEGRRKKNVRSGGGGGGGAVRFTKSKSLRCPWLDENFFNCQCLIRQEKNGAGR